MFKKGLVALVCLTVMSALWSWATTTYSISTKINSLGTEPTVVNGKTVYVPIVGGHLKTRIDGVADYIVADQTNGIKYTTVTTDKLVDVEIDADAPNYKIASVTKTTNGTTETLVRASDNATSYVVEDVAPASSTQFIVVTFAANTTSDVVRKVWQLQVTNNNGGGGIEITRAGVVTPVNYAVKPLVKNFIDTTPVTVDAKAADGYTIDYVVVNGVKDNTDRATFSMTVDGTNTLNTFNVGYKKNSISVTTNSSDPFVDNGIAPINPVADPYGKVNLIVTPTGTQNVVKTVTATGGTVAVFDRYGNETTLPHFGPVKVTVSGITGPITVAATYGTDLTKTAAIQNCTNTCHIDPALLASKPAVNAAGTTWTGSTHAAQGVTCITCHQTMPGPSYKTASAKDALCASCHSNTNAAFPAAKYELHTAAQNSCSTCHTFTGGHNPAKTNIGTAALHNGGVCSSCHAAAPTNGTIAAHKSGLPFHKAQYESTASVPVTCANCHSASAPNQAIHAQYAASAHADTAGEAWVHFDWRGGDRASCARCHNGTAFVAKIGNENNVSNLFQTGDNLKPGEVLACSSCHTDAGTGALRTAGNDFPQTFTINMRNGATAEYTVAGASSLCARCHSGRETGASIAADSDTTGVRVFVDSHYQPVTGILYENGGYEFAGQTYTPGKHQLLGATGQGPCVTCHMANKNHSFGAVACGTCHTGLDQAALKAAYDTALDNLKVALETDGIFYGPVHPFFFTAAYTEGGTNVPVTNWNKNGSWKDTMGAAFNYNMLRSDKGAYAHNNAYAMKLIEDSIAVLAGQ